MSMEFHWKDSQTTTRPLPKKLMGAWFQCPRKLGQPQKFCQILAISMLRTMIPKMIKHGKFSEFFKLAKDENK